MLDSHFGSSCHHVFEGSQLRSCVPITRTKMTNSGWLVLAVSLLAKSTASVISLVFVNWSSLVCGSACFWECPSGIIILSGGISWCLWNISSWADCIWSGSLVFECASCSPSISKRIEWFLSHFRALLWKILGSGCLLHTIHSHPWFCPDLWCSASLFPCQISVNRVIQESSIFIKFILGLSTVSFLSVTERPARSLNN